MHPLVYIASHDDLIEDVNKRKITDGPELLNYGKWHHEMFGSSRSETEHYNAYVCACGYNLLCDKYWDFENDCLNEYEFTLSFINIGHSRGIKRNPMNLSFVEAYNTLMHKRKVVLLFWGLTRSLKYTLNSIYTNVIKQLHLMNYIVCISIHTYMLDYLTNARSREKNLKLDKKEWAYLAPNYYKIEEQQDVIKNIDLPSYRKLTKDPWKDKYKSFDNMVLGMRSQYMSYQNVKHLYFDYYIYLRPDVFYVDKLKYNMLSCCNDNTIAIPNFGHYGGCNDRFAITTKKTVDCYHRFDFLKTCGLKILHSETILNKKLLKSGINTKEIKFRFNRVRANGRMQMDYVDLL